MIKGLGDGEMEAWKSGLEERGMQKGLLDRCFSRMASIVSEKLLRLSK